MPEVFLLKAFIIIVILSISFFLLSKYSFKFPIKTGKAKKIKVIDLNYIGKDNIIALIEVENSKILIGINNNQIIKLKEWTNETIKETPSNNNS